LDENKRHICLLSEHGKTKAGQKKLNERTHPINRKKVIILYHPAQF